MRLWPKTWHPETWVCSMRGHVIPAAHARVVRPEDTALGAELSDGRRLARCLRCDTWIEHAPPTGVDVDYEHVPALAELPKPRRGHPLDEAIVMRLIAINKATHALGFTILASAALLLQTNLSAVKSFAQRVLSGVTSPLSDTGDYANKSWLSRELEKLLNLNPGTIILILLIATLCLGAAVCNLRHWRRVTRQPLVIASPVELRLAPTADWPFRRSFRPRAGLEPGLSRSRNARPTGSSPKYATAARRSAT